MSKSSHGEPRFLVRLTGRRERLAVRWCLVLACALSLACEDKGFRDEVVFTGASAAVRPDAPSPVDTALGPPNSTIPRSPLEASASPDPSTRPPRVPDVDGGSMPGPSPEPAAPPRADGGSPVAPEPEPRLEPEPRATVEPSPEPEPEPTAPPVVEFSKRALVEGIGQCALGLFERFQVEAESLADAAAQHAAESTPERYALVQERWVSAMLVWQRAELFRFGPAASTSEPGGRGLRDQIYAWNRNPPGNNRCRIEQALVHEDYADAGFGNALVVVRTLSALEFLSFHQGSETACTAFDDIVADGSWAALTAAELEARRAAYAEVVAAQVAERARELVNAWSPSGGDFLGEFTSKQSELYPSEQSALNAVASGLFYMDKDVKDYKLGMPLGLVPECPKASCPEAFESQYARASTLLLYENLAGFEDLFSGCGGEPSALGFDDWLRAMGATDLAERMQAAIDDAQRLVATLDPPLEDALVVEPAKVAAVHTAVKGVTDLLKSEFISLLDLELPSAVATDND